MSVRTRTGRDVTACFPELPAIAEQLDGRELLLDGELVCLDSDGLPSFEHVRRRGLARRAGTIAAGAAATPARLVAFDLLHLDGRSTRALPYRRRRELLEALALEGPAWTTPRWFPADRGAALLAATREAGLEGVVAKRLDAPYAAGRRSRAALKLKHWRRARVCVTAWRPAPPGELDTYFLRHPDGRYAGQAQLGLTAPQRAELRAALRAATAGEGPRGIVNVTPGAVLLDVDHHGAGQLASHRLQQHRRDPPG